MIVLFGVVRCVQHNFLKVASVFHLKFSGYTRYVNKIKGNCWKEQIILFSCKVGLALLSTFDSPQIMQICCFRVF